MDSLKTTIESIKDKYFTFEEFPLIERDRFPADCLKKAMAVKKSEIESYAANLKTKEIEGLLLDVVLVNNKEEAERASQILLYRKSPRIIKLVSFLSQYHYDSYGVNFICSVLANKAGDLLNENSYIKKFGNENDKVRSLAQVFGKEKQDLWNVCKKYGILEMCPLALESYLLFFLDCDKTAFLINYEKVIVLIRNYAEEKIHGILLNYLNGFAFVEYSDEINMAIVEKLGRPYVSQEWYPFSKELRDKFAQWYYLHQLKQHCQEQPQKFDLLIKYFELVRTNFTINEDNVLITDFGNIIIVDIKGKLDSFLYDKFLFEKEMAIWRESEEILPTFLRSNEKAMTAREFMLSTETAYCVKLTFSDVDYYYIDEVLEIKLGLEPDMRKNKTKANISNKE